MLNGRLASSQWKCQVLMTGALGSMTPQKAISTSKWQILMKSKDPSHHPVNNQPNLSKLEYFTNLDFPEIMGIPLLNHHLEEIGRVRSRANWTRTINPSTQSRFDHLPAMLFSLLKFLCFFSGKGRDRKLQNKSFNWGANSIYTPKKINSWFTENLLPIIEIRKNHLNTFTSMALGSNSREFSRV